jgi:hypothetical protein
LHSPAVHKKTHGHDEAANRHHIEAMLGHEVTLCDMLRGYLVAKVCADQLTDQ